MKEFPDIHHTPTNSYEDFKIKFSERMEQIANLEISPENIDHIFDVFLNDLTELVEEVVTAYAEISEKQPEPDDRRGFEDESFAYFDLANIDKILDVAKTKHYDFTKSKDILAHSALQYGDVTPTDNVTPLSHEQPGLFKERLSIPRLQTLLYILVSDRIIEKPEDIKIVQGEVTDEMMREEPYFRIEVSQCGRVVYVCDEEGNASYVFDLEKLKRAGIELGDLDEMTKIKKGLLIDSVAGLGVRYTYSPKWINETRSYLYEPLSVGESEQTEKRSSAETLASLIEVESLPTTSRDRQSEWFGFWTDPETGEHWGGARGISEKVGFDSITFEKVYGDLERKKIRFHNGAYDAFSYEKAMLIDKVKDRSTAKNVEKSGEWTKFYVHTDGKHYAGSKLMAEKIGFSQSFVEGNFNKVDLGVSVANAAGIVVDEMYCYEDIVSDPVYIEVSKAETVEIEGSWEGFYTDQEGKHWGSINVINKKTGLGKGVIDKNYVKKSEIKVKVKTKTGELIQDMLCLEDVLSSPGVVEVLKAYPVVKEGEWTGFYVDDKHEHWGGIKGVAAKLNISRNFLRRSYVKTHDLNASIRTSMGLIDEVYSYEQAVDSPRIKSTKEANMVELEGDWNGFWTDPVTGEHWSGYATLGRKLGISPSVVAKKYTGSIMKDALKDRTGKLIEEAYSYEQAVALDNQAT